MQHPIYIPSYHRHDVIRTHHLLEGKHPYYIVVHNQEEYEKYCTNPTINPQRLLISQQPIGLCQQRQWILERIPYGEWVLMMDDNIAGFTALQEPWYQYKNVPVKTQKIFCDRFKQEISLEKLLDCIAQDIVRAEKIQAHLIGFSPSENFYFREHHYSTIGYVIGKMIVVKKSDLQYDMGLLSIDDHDFTAQNLLIFGSVLINRFIYPVAGHFEHGGLGTYQERLKKRLQDCRYLIEKYPGLFRFKKYRDWHPEQDVALKIYSHPQLETWRKSMLTGKR